jgi:hypothetical protein
MDGTLKLLRLVRIALMISVVLYAIVGEQAKHTVAVNPTFTLYLAVTIAAIFAVSMIVVMRRLLVLPAEAALAIQSQDAAALGRWRAGHIVIYGLSESVALFGLVLRFLGFPFSEVVTFYAVGLILLMFFGPRQPSHDIG